MSQLGLLVCLLMAGACAAAQSITPPSDCPAPEIVLDRYVVAVGGQAAVDRLRTLAIEAHESEPHTFNPQSIAHTHYWFKWKSPNQVAMRSHYLLSPATFRFDGAAWSNFDGRLSHNENGTPASRLKLRADYLYNDDPQFVMLRLVANPILLATARNLYRSFDPLPGPPGTCTLQATGPNQWGGEQRDILTFDAKNGFLKTWAMQAGLPWDVMIYIHFQFDDYRQSGDVKIPYSIYFDFYKATFQLTKAVPNAAVSDVDFIPKH